MLVYPPDEDTFLLEDAILLDLPTITPAPKIIVEVGAGSGYISHLLRRRFPLSYVISTDVSPHAVSATKSLLDPLKNGEVLRSSIVDGISSVDVALFNPPYLPSSSQEMNEEWIDRSWAGGRDGLEVIDLFLKQTEEVPIRYLLLCSLNNPYSLMAQLSASYSCSVLLSRCILGENLLVLKIIKKQV